MVTYLEKLAASVDAEIHTSTRATAVETSGRGFVVRTNTGTDFKAAGVICASGSFSNPYLPQIPGDFSGQLLHVANYRGPGQYAGQRVIVVGAGNSAIQVGYSRQGARRADPGPGLRW